MEDSQELRKYITCDAERCGQIHPANRCSKCKIMMFYCSRDCQKADWKKHKPDCHAVVDMKKSSAGVDGLSQIEEITGIAEGKTETAGPCAICLEEEIVDPIVFSKCKHAFCLSCLIHFQTSNKVPNSIVWLMERSVRAVVRRYPTLSCRRMRKYAL